MAQETAADVWDEKGMKLAEKGKLKEAKECLNRALELYIEQRNKAGVEAVSAPLSRLERETE